MEQLVIDAEGFALGRLASYAAKQSLLGRKVIIVNCNKAVIVGNPKSVIGEYRILKARGGASLKGPFFHKSAEKVIKRSVRGMLSYKQGRGKDALKRVMCYNEIPEEFASAEKISYKRVIKTKSIKLNDLIKEI